MPFLTLNFYLLPFNCSAQVAINTSGANPDASAGLDVSFTNKGLLIPRLSLAQRGTIILTGTPTGCLIYQTDNTPGYYYYDGTAWQLLGRYIAGSGISIVGNVISNTAPSSGGTVTSVTGTLPIAVATGTTTPVISITGLSSLGVANQIPGVNAGATGWEYKTLTPGTGISITNAAGSITLTNTAPSSGGTVTNIATGTGLTGGPITTTGTISLVVPVSIANGGTNITTIGGNGSVIYSNGTQHSSTAVGAAGNILTSTGAGAPTWNTLASLGAVTMGCANDNFVVKRSGANNLACSIIQDNGSTVGVNATPNASYRLFVDGASSITGVYGQYNANNYGWLGGASWGGYCHGGAAGSTEAYAELGMQNGEGVYGFAYNDDGVEGHTANSSYYGVNGINDNAASGSGVFGYGLTYGVVGSSAGASGTGVYGYTTGATGYGVYGWNNAAAGASVGFGGLFLSYQTGGAALVGTLGTNSYYAGAGVSGIANSTVAGGFGVIGKCDNATGTGVWGQTSGAGGASDGVYGIGSSATGDAFGGYNSSVTGTGIIVGGNNVATLWSLVGGSGGAFTGTLYGVYAKSTQAGATQNAAVEGDNGSSGVVSWLSLYNGTMYKTISSGASTNSCAVPNLNGNYVCMHAPESPEAYFDDYGQGQLINGKVHIDIDPVFAKNVRINEKHPLRVFVQLEGDCNGVYITNKTETGFDVIELNSGVSNTHFQWHIVCNMRDAVMPSGVISKFEDLRFEPAPKVLETSTTEPKKPAVMHDLKQKSIIDKPTENKK